MAQLFKASRVVRVPLAAVVNPAEVILHPTTGRDIGDPWVDIGPGAEVDTEKWPADRICLSRTRGRPPEKVQGAGKAALDKMRERRLLVPCAVELPPDPARQRTVPDTDIFDKSGKARTMEVRKPDDDEDEDEPKKARKRGK